MRPSRHSDVQRLSAPAGSPLADRLGGLDNLLDQAMDLSVDEEKAASKPEPKETLDEDTSKLLNFDDFLVSSKSTVKPEKSMFKIQDIPIKTIDEIVEDEPVLLAAKPAGASTVSPSLSSVDTGNRKYKLFVCPEMMECDKLCKTFIGQGTTVCMNVNCLINHRQKKVMSVVEGQLFVTKIKDAVFAEPTFDEAIDDAVLDNWKNLSLTIAQWREKFEIVRKVAKEGSDIKPQSVKEQELKMEIARDYKNPMKRRVHESLEEDDVEMYDTIEVDDTLDWDKAKAYFDKIDKALQIKIKRSIKNFETARLN